jgi:hypothetical protein
MYTKSIVKNILVGIPMSQWHQIKSYLIEVYESITIQTSLLDVNNYHSLIES